MTKEEYNAERLRLIEIEYASIKWAFRYLKRISKYVIVTKDKPPAFCLKVLVKVLALTAEINTSKTRALILAQTPMPLFEKGGLTNSALAEVWESGQKKMTDLQFE